MLLALALSQALSADAFETSVQAAKTAAEFRELAGKVPPADGLLDDARSRYELVLVSTALGDEEARKQLPSAWDDLQNLTGRPRRMIAMAEKLAPAKYRTAVAPKLLRDVWTGKKPKGTQDSAELAKIFEEDQKVRQGDWSKMAQKQIEEMVKSDMGRLARTRTLVKQGKLSTGKDFVNAAFVFQHSSEFEDYATAHELGVAAMLLGNKNGKWIAGAAYDRMMLSAGYPQRFGTQFRMVAGKFDFSPIDKRFVSDTMRRAIIGKSLEEALKVFDR
jgi:hypothetical protein